ncbi:MAG: efflux RND transporter permease subunit, partial [Roseiarcus sp.]
LRSYGLSAEDVVTAVGRQDLIIPVGTQKIGSKEYVIQLNDSPESIDDLNFLPIRSANGATVRIGDVAHVHDSYPPQINMVRVDGANAVLMTIVKAGSASTLDVINGVKELLPRLRELIPAELKLAVVGDQSPFVQNAVSSVIFEGALAATLTGLMILVFLGSWRSTLIIIIAIPLAILASVALLAATGENINVMTLGGLALAVGILVDDGTVTIENINFQLEQKKEIEAAIMDGARQIVIPATVSLLCICIVFVPMFGLGGISGYLFRPMAKAVVFALIGSYILARTLVPTMANYLLGGHAHDPEAPPRTIFARFQRGFEHKFTGLREGYAQTLATAMRLRWTFVLGFLGFVAASLLLFPFLGQNFFPDIESVQLKLHVRGPTGLRIEETGRLITRVETAIGDIAGPGIVASMVDNIGMPISGINAAYGNSGTIGSSDADILITLQEGQEKNSAELVRRLREKLPEQFPDATFAFLPADIVTQILNFGLPAPIDVQVVGNNLEGNRILANKLLKRIAEVTGVADARIQQPADLPTIRVDVDRTQADRLGVTEKDIATSLQITLAGSIQTNPTFWLNPQNGVSYPVVTQTPQYWMQSFSDLARIPVSQGKSPQILGAVADISRASSNAVVSHYSVQPVIDIYATNSGRDLGGVSTDIQRIIRQLDAERPRGSQIILRGQTATMTSAYSQLYQGLALAVVLIYLLIVVNFQSWLDPFVIVSALPAALAGVTWMLFATHTTLSVPALTGAIMCMGVATANSILVVSFAREQLAEGLEPFAAALNAGVGRFRPVLMTALAMIIGMAPMALSAEQNAPLGRAVIGGLIFATVATLIFVPVVFAMAHSRKSRSEASMPPASTEMSS